MLTSLKSASAVGLLAGALLLGGCATKEEVEHAQATADQAMSAAQRAQSTADSATSAAQAAGSTAQAAAADAQKANTRLDTVESNVDHLMHHHEHGTFRNVGVRHGPLQRMPSSPTPANPPTTPQQ